MNIFSEIQGSLTKLYPFTNEQLDQFTKRLVPGKLRKKNFLLTPGQISNCLTFINAGSLRLFTTIDHAELTIDFFTRGQWVTDIESLLSQQSSKNFIEALEDSEIASISLKDIHELMDIHPYFRMLNGLMAGLTISSSHLAAISKKSPDMRYRDLLSEHPDWINRFPQKHIASYLGVTPETLSRVRARIS